MKKYRVVLFQSMLVLCIFFTGSIAFASENAEIQYLLAHLGESGCTFIRNSTEYEAGEARAHLEMKYNYGKSRIKTAESFIKKIASKSSLSRKAYLVRCGEEETPSKQWLENVLKMYRENLKKR